MSSSENIKISVKAWSEAMSDAPTNCSEIFNAINEVVSNFPENEQYVYSAQFPFGAKLIENGSIPIDKFSFTSNPAFKPENKNNLKDDLRYSNDPLGVISKNHIEVYAQNKSNEIEYNIIFH
jgi:hypothetical protein